METNYIKRGTHFYFKRSTPRKITSEFTNKYAPYLIEIVDKWKMHNPCGAPACCTEGHYIRGTHFYFERSTPKKIVSEFTNKYAPYLV